MLHIMKRNLDKASSAVLSLLFLTAASLPLSLLAQNRAVLTLAGGQSATFPTASLKDIQMEGNRVTVNPTTGQPVTYDGQVARISFLKVGTGAVSLLDAKGWLESAYITFEPFQGASAYHVYIKGGDDADYVRLDTELVRDYTSYLRADAVGLRPGTYSMKVVPVVGGKELATSSSEATGLQVSAYSREGFAHKGYTGVGAYNDDGTLKEGANVIYVSAANAKTVQLSLGGNTFTGIQGILKAYEKGNLTTPLAVRIIGCLRNGDTDEFGSSSEGLQIKGKRADSELNITIEGIGNDATIYGFGFLVRNSRSVEFRNLAIMRQMDDGISLDTDNSNIWIHNVDVFYGRAGSGDHAKGDGSIDVKADSKFVTISYCHFWDNGKTSMCGMKSESGPNYITYHHNWFDHSDSRHARVRTMSVHMWNNYFDGCSKYGIGATSASSIFSEQNYFRHTHNPFLISLQGTDAMGKGTFSGEPGGIIKDYGSVLAETGGSAYYVPIAYSDNATSFDVYQAQRRNEQVPASVKTLSGNTTYDNFDTDASLMYSYTPDDAADVPARVTGFLGAGRINHGDLVFNFDNSKDDESYEVNTGLASLIDKYTGYRPATSSNPDTPEDTTKTDTIPQQPTTPVEGTIVISFDKSGQPSNSIITVVGNGSNSKGSITYNGKTYTTCLKMESKTSITCHLTQAVKATFIFGPTESATLKIDGKKVAGTDNTITATLAAGDHTITKANQCNLFLIVLEPEE